MVQVVEVDAASCLHGRSGPGSSFGHSGRHLVCGRRCGGPTAVHSVLVALRWLRINLGFAGFPLESPLLRGASVCHPERVLRQAAELPLKVWAQYSTQAAQGAGTLRLVASLILYLATVSLRFKHAQRRAFQRDVCGDRALVGRVSNGKSTEGRLRSS